MKELARPNVWMFLMLTFGLSWALMMVPGWFLGSSPYLQLVQVILFAWGPALAAVVMRKWVFSSSLKGLGWNRKYYDYRWISLTLFGPLGVLIGTIALVFLLGNVFHIPGFGRIDIGLSSSTLSIGSLKEISLFSFIQDPMIDALNGEFWNTVLILAGLMIVIGASIGLLVHLGPEMGFRGYFLKELQPLGFLGGNTIVGLSMGAWQSFMLLLLLPEWSSQYLPIFLTIMGFHLCMAFPAAWLSLRTRSVYASATFISVLNQVSGLLVLFLWNSDPSLAGVNGLAGMLILLLATGAILIWDKDFVNDYEKLVY